MAERTVTILKVVKGWVAMIAVNSEPVRMGPGRESPIDALKDVAQFAKQYRCEIVDLKKYARDCEKHPEEWTANGRCSECVADEIRRITAERVMSSANY